MKYWKRKRFRTNNDILAFSCPNCGKMNSAPVRTVKTHFLDGTPRDLEAFLSGHPICSCGCVCEKDMLTRNNNITEVINSAEYQSILHGNYDEVEKKLRLMSFFPDWYGCTSVFLTHVHDNAETIKSAIAELKEMMSKYPLKKLRRTVPCEHLFAGTCHGYFIITAEMQLADMYRRIGDFDNARACLDNVWQQNPDSLPTNEYIATQHQLINEQDMQAW